MEVIERGCARSAAIFVVRRCDVCAATVVVRRSPRTTSRFINPGSRKAPSRRAGVTTASAKNSRPLPICAMVPSS